MPLIVSDRRVRERCRAGAKDAHPPDAITASLTPPTPPDRLDDLAAEGDGHPGPLGAALGGQEAGVPEDFGGRSGLV